MKKLNNEYLPMKIVMALSYIYLASSFIIFALGYLKIWIAIPTVIIICISLILTIKNSPKIAFPEVNNKKILKLIIVILIITFWVILSGIGKVAWQGGDQIYRNGIFEGLVNASWPVGHGYINGNNAEVGMLVYYIGFWLPSAVIGKIFNVEIGYYFQIFWAVFGLFLMFILISAYRKKISIWTLFIFIFFSGWDIILTMILNKKWIPIFSTEWLELPFGKYCFTSNTTNLFCVFNQTIPAWLVVILLLLQENHKNIVFLMGILLISSVFPFIGLIPIVVYFIFSKYDKNNSKKSLNLKTRSVLFIQSLCTFQNVLGGGISGIITFMYLKGNLAGNSINPIIEKDIVNKGVQKAAQGMLLTKGNIDNFNLFNNMNVKEMINNDAISYLIFIFLEVGIYLILLYKSQKKNKLYWIMTISLLIVPLIQVGSSTDFSMRASIPTLFILYLFVIDFFDQSPKRSTFLMLIITLVVGSISAFHEIARPIVYRNLNQRNTVSLSLICGGQNFSGNSEDIFFRKMSKPLKMEKMNKTTIDYCIENTQEYSIFGPIFSVEDNGMMVQNMNIQIDGLVDNDIVFRDKGMLDDNSVNFILLVNGNEVGVLDYETREIIIPKHYFNEYAQVISIAINKEVKLYKGDTFEIEPKG